MTKEWPFQPQEDQCVTVQQYETCPVLCRRARWHSHMKTRQTYGWGWEPVVYHKSIYPLSWKFIRQTRYITCVFGVLRHLCVLSFTSLVCFGFYITCVFQVYITCVFWVLHHLCVLGFKSLVCFGFYVNCVFCVLYHLCVLGFISHVCSELYITCVFWVLHHLCVPSAFEATVTSLYPAAIKTLPMGATELLPWPFEIIWLLI